MRAKTLERGGTIGICSPCRTTPPEEIAEVKASIEAQGFKVKIAPNISTTGYGYISSAEARAADFNGLIADPEVDLVMFTGGEGGVDIVPLIDYEAIKANPKRILAFSDSTTILNIIYTKTGLETYYGQGPSFYENIPVIFADEWEYNTKMFYDRIVDDTNDQYETFTGWKVQHGGVGEGILFGGYARNVALLPANRHFEIDMNEKYILFVEDCEVFGEVDYVSAMISNIEQMVLMDNITGVIFGHYSDTEYPDLLARLKRLGDAHNIPVVATDDFGHDKFHAIFPIGRRAVLDADNKTLTYK